MLSYLLCISFTFTLYFVLVHFGILSNQHRLWTTKNVRVTETTTIIWTKQDIKKWNGNAKHFDRKNGNLHALNNLPNATVTVYTVPSANNNNNTAREHLNNTNNIYGTNNYGNNYYPNNNYPPNYYNPDAYAYPTYPNANNYAHNNNVNYVPMPTQMITVDTNKKNLVIYGWNIEKVLFFSFISFFIFAQK